jgi:hypothetical protein
MVADALRSTLDSLQLDPSVQKDRHYLITMLRRLGYTELEIRQALGEAEEPVVQTEVTTVELEYTEGEEELELLDFERVTPSREGGFVVHEDPESVVFEGVEDTAEFEILENQVLKFEEIAPPAPGKRTRLRVVSADSPEAAADIARSQGHEVVHTVPVNVRQTGSAPQDEWVKSTETNGMAAEDEAWEWHDAVEEPTQPTWDEESSWEDAAEPTPEPLPEMAPEAETWENESWEAEPKTVGVEGEHKAPAAKSEAVWEAEPMAEVADEFVGDAIEPIEEVGAEYYSRNGYVLHMRKAKLPSGKTETLYFFAKGVSESGTPIPLPDGYVVREHPGSKLPYITRDDV